VIVHNKLLRSQCTHTHTTKCMPYCLFCSFTFSSLHWLYFNIALLIHTSVTMHILHTSMPISYCTVHILCIRHIFITNTHTHIYIYLLLNKRYNSCKVLAFSTIFFHSRVLNLFRPFLEFHLSQVVSDVVPSLFRSSYWSSYVWLPFVYICYHTGFRFSMDLSKPTQSLGTHTHTHTYIYICQEKCSVGITCNKYMQTHFKHVTEIILIVINSR
jgi:hypothetical protein